MILNDPEVRGLLTVLAFLLLAWPVQIAIDEFKTIQRNRRLRPFQQHRLRQPSRAVTILGCWAIVLINLLVLAALVYFIYSIIAMFL